MKDGLSNLVRRTRRTLSGQGMRSLVTPLLVLPLILSACAQGTTPAPSAAAGRIQVVTTTTVLADLIQNVGGENVTVTSLVPRGGEVHTFDPPPGTLVKVAEARLVIANGLGLDDWLIELASQASKQSGSVIELGRDLPGVTYLGEQGAPLPSASPSEGANPHLWLNVQYASLYVSRIEEALVSVDAANAAAYHARAGAYRERLAALNAWAQTQMQTIPQDARRIVSFHDAFPYFAHAYGLEIVGVAVEAPGQDPSAGQIAALIDAIRTTGVRAVFTEAQFSPALAETIASETGTRVISNLFSDSVGDAPADTYEGLVRWDVARIVEALR
jgi:manganese/iron transport system substrate-binding protein